MRALAVTLALVASLSFPAAGASPTQTQPSTVLVVGGADGGVLLAWTPIAGAESYDVWRGPDAGNLTLLATTSMETFTDAPPGGSAAYGITAHLAGVPSNLVYANANRGDCVSMSTDLQWRVSLENCLS